MKKIKIAIDLDDTLVSTVNLLVKEMLKDRSFPAFRGYHSIKDFSFDEEMALYKYIRTTVNKQDIKKFKPIPGCVSVVKELSKTYDLYLVTARTKNVKKHTRDWISHHFPNCFKKIIFGQYLKEGEFKKTKGEICKELGISLIIDDRYDYCLDCHKHGIRAIVFDYKGNYVWSKGKLPKEIKIIKNWKEVSEIIKKTKF
ncbi:MAG: NIF family HAD-type phosphatase [Candidatus Pacearchaeota archaeon]|jgi:uncharacterized HAD superfamily protein